MKKVERVNFNALNFSKRIPNFNVYRGMQNLGSNE